MTNWRAYLPDGIPNHIGFTWTPTKSALVVWCDNCNCGVCIYATVMRKDEEVITRAVEEHRGCTP